MKIRATALALALVSGSAFAAEPVGSSAVALGMTAGQLTAVAVTTLVVAGAAAAASSGGSSATGTTGTTGTTAPVVLQAK